MTEQNLPEIYNDILPLGDRTDRSGETPKARIGGWMYSPRISPSYLLAARRLIGNVGPGDGPQVGVVALPIVFLQRHSYELALKDLIEVAYEIERGRRWVAAVRAEGPEASVAAAKRPAREHQFGKILEELKEVLLAIGFDVKGIRDEMRAMAERLTTIEEGQHTRARYGDFAKPKELELGRVQLDLEDLYQREFWARDQSDLYARDTLYAWLGSESLAIDSELYALQAL
ncbi:MAG: hypothetical protein IPH07_15650 [Deltaproteobacteria bacterium]|nr:hypothetical protein [Deltaproteobacteria bacterium]MBK8239214.1 hypothetical protein [Deltaproteobacteria bacterium]MBK8719715.1 hypothetical protein [Deltaproteobacteria bacterium]MBP7288671.1 hypothetical protein [Nannocystaceae bacterium]